MAPKPDDHSDHDERAARPGVQYITNDAASRFDERIAEKRNKHSTNNKNSSNTSSTGNVVGPRMIEDDDTLNQKPPPRPSSREQEDMEAKRRARDSSATARTAVARAPPSSNRMDEDRQAKERAKSSYRKPVPGSHQEASTNGANKNATSLSTLDRDIEAKNQARRSLVSGNMTAKKPPTRATVSTATVRDDDADTAAKNRARSSSSKGPAMIPGVFYEENKKCSSNGTPSGDIVFGGGGTQNNNRKAAPHGLDAADRMAKQNAAAPRYISLDDNASNDPLAGNKKHAGADAAYGGSQDNHKKTMHNGGGVASHSNAGSYKNDHDPEAALQGKMFAANGGAGRGREDDGLGEFGEFGVMDMASQVVEFNNLEDNKLAVATAVVEEEEEDAFIPAAVEFDPDAKPSLYKSRRFRLYGCLGFLLVLVAIVAIVIPTQVTNKGNNMDGPTSAPTTYRESLGIQEQLEKFVGSTKLYDVGSPHYKALDWLLHEDAMQLSPEAENLLQRYIVALFYFQASAEGPWRSCNPPTGNQTADCMYKSIVSIIPLMYEPVPAIRWLSDKHECEWVGVVCETGRIHMLQIRGQGMTGGFPEELSNLPFLRSINFAWNELSGPLPKSIAATMKQLTNLELHSNFFNGTLPSEFFKFDNLNRFNMGTNKLTGTLAIPPDATISALDGIFLFENEISGSIPPEIGRLSALAYLRLSKNKITGSIPSEIGLLSDLQEIWVHYSSVNGTIPTEIGALEKLQDFRAHNTSLSGEIPDELYGLPSIDRIDIFNTNVTGTISTLIGQLTTLDVLRVRGSKLEGQIPSEIGLLTELRSVWLHQSGISGTIPDSLCQLRIESILNELAADCSVSQNSGIAAVDCPVGCCTQCCDRVTEACVDMRND